VQCVSIIFGWLLVLFVWGVGMPFFSLPVGSYPSMAATPSTSARLVAIVMDAFGARQFQSSNKAVTTVIDFDLHEFTRRVNEVCINHSGCRTNCRRTHC
jgi:hypothetical protein